MSVARLASSDLRISFAFASTIAFFASGMTTTAVSSAKTMSPGLTWTGPSMTGSLTAAVLRSLDAPPPAADCRQHEPDLQKTGRPTLSEGIKKVHHEISIEGP